MPRSCHKTRGRNARPDTQHSAQIDFTLADYADAATTLGSGTRIKKGATNALIDVKKLCSKGEEKAGEDVSWYDKDFNTDEEPDEPSDSEAGAGALVRSPAKKTVKRSRQEEGGVDYPLDVWFLISHHIEPEDIWRFASICRSSHYVLHTAQFWTNLYWRYLPLDRELPESLQPAFINKLHGLRTRVVRVLFLTYPPFMQRMQQAPFEDTPDSILGSRCVLMWYREDKGFWNFYFKLERGGRLGCPLTPSKVRRRGKYSLENFETDLYDNPEQACVVLQVRMRTFTSIPHTVLGMTLYKTSVSVGHGMMNHKLKLIFTPQSGCVDKAVALAGGTTISLDPVISMRVLHWWDPKYPR